jgi:hypothetical protein
MKRGDTADELAREQLALLELLCWEGKSTENALAKDKEVSSTKFGTMIFSFIFMQWKKYLKIKKIACCLLYSPIFCFGTRTCM